MRGVGGVEVIGVWNPDSGYSMRIMLAETERGGKSDECRLSPGRGDEKNGELYHKQKKNNQR